MNVLTCQCLNEIYHLDMLACQDDKFHKKPSTCLAHLICFKDYLIKSLVCEER